MSSIITGSSANSFWSKPEGKFGVFVSTVLAGLFGYGLFKILPSLVQMAQNIFVLGAYCAAIMAGFYVLVLDNRLRNMFVNFYKRLMRALYILSFNVDPIGGLKTRLVELRERIRDAREQAAKVKSQAQATQGTIDQNNKVIEEGLSKMETAKRHGQESRARAESIKVGAAREANQPLIDLKVRLDRSFVQISSIIEKGELNVDVIETIVTVKERSFKAAKAGRSAMRAAMEALTGETEKDDLFRTNLEWIDEYTAEAVGEMDAMLELNASAINSIDLTQMSYSDKAFQMLEERQGKVEELLTTDDRAQKLISAPYNPDYQSIRSNDPELVSTPAAPDFSGVFGRSKDRNK
jgi:hypothetical protein